MYHQYFGLTEAPFSIAVNPRYLFMSPRHRDALAHLLYGVGAGGGFILLTGEVGTGKTTINRCLLEQLPDDTDIAIILNPALNAMELLATVCDEFGIAYDHDKHTLKTLTDSLHRFLLANHARNRKTVLLIDEAQHLDFDVLEQIRLLTNLETNSEKLLQIILIGQPELGQMLGKPELRQLNQRITARYNLEPLSLAETGAYIRHRLQVAGLSAGQDIFPTGVVRGVHRVTRGIPRLINVLCDRMMLGAYGRNQGNVDLTMLRIAAREVMGEDPTPRSERATGWGPILMLGALVVALAAGWWWRSVQGPAVAPAAAVAAQDRTVGLAGVVEQAGPATPGRQGASAIEAVAPPAESVTAVAAMAEPEMTSGMAAMVEAGSPDGQWMQAPMAALAQLWSLYRPLPLPLDLCAGEAQQGVACVEGTARTWDDLSEYDRPLMLDMISPERFAAAVLFLGFNGRNAWVATPQGIAEVTLAELGPSWSGNYRLLWQPPEGFSRPLGLGDSSPTVAMVAELFARLDGQQRALADNRFTPALQARVRLFQREHGLASDGVVGMQTLLKLNEALGIDLTAAGARDRLAQNPVSGASR